MATNVLSTPQGPPSPPSAPSPAPAVRRTVGQRVWVGISSAGAVVLGVAPHVLHHIGLFAGALFAGVGGSLLFGAVGFLAAIPFLLRIHRRTGTWRVPGALLALFAVVFSISTFVVGSAITGTGAGSEQESSPSSGQTSQPTAPRSTQKNIHGH
jgi:hypothetical protein